MTVSAATVRAEIETLLAGWYKWVIRLSYRAMRSGSFYSPVCHSETTPTTGIAQLNPNSTSLPGSPRRPKPVGSIVSGPRCSTTASELTVSLCGKTSLQWCLFGAAPQGGRYSPDVKIQTASPCSETVKPTQLSYRTATVTTPETTITILVFTRCLEQSFNRSLSALHHSLTEQCPISRRSCGPSTLT